MARQHPANLEHLDRALGGSQPMSASHEAVRDALAAMGPRRHGRRRWSTLFRADRQSAGRDRRAKMRRGFWGPSARRCIASWSTKLAQPTCVRAWPAQSGSRTIAGIFMTTRVWRSGHRRRAWLCPAIVVSGENPVRRRLRAVGLLLAGTTVSMAISALPKMALPGARLFSASVSTRHSCLVWRIEGCS